MPDISLDLLNKYNTNNPRYTSYPTVLDWHNNVNSTQWFNLIKKPLIENKKTGLYIHIPFCQRLCTFCACNKIITLGYDKAVSYVDYVIKEFHLYLEKLELDFLEVKEIHLGGGTPTYLEPKEIDKLLSNILKKCKVDANPLFSAEIDPRHSDKDKLQVLYDYGFRRLSLGVQDFDPAVQRIINRIQSYQVVEDSVKVARDIGFTSINFDLLYGLPNQTFESIALTMDYISKLQPDRIAFYSYAHVPWFSKVQVRHEKFNLPLGEDKIQLFLKGKNLLEGLGYKAIGMDHFALEKDSLYQAYLNNSLHRNFMGYIESYAHPVIGLGVSAISDSWDSYIQNTKDLKQYYKSIDKNTLPIIKSHLLTSNQKIARLKILELMTQFETNLDPASLQLVIEKGRDMLNDGLFTLDETKLKITECGKFFIRNICTLFDENYNHNQDTATKFSKSV